MGLIKNSDNQAKRETPPKPQSTPLYTLIAADQTAHPDPLHIRLNHCSVNTSTLWFSVEFVFIPLLISLSTSESHVHWGLEDRLSQCTFIFLWSYPQKHNTCIVESLYSLLTVCPRIKPHHRPHLQIKQDTNSVLYDSNELIVAVLYIKCLLSNVVIFYSLYICCNQYI